MLKRARPTDEDIRLNEPLIIADVFLNGFEIEAGPRAVRLIGWAKCAGRDVATPTWTIERRWTSRSSGGRSGSAAVSVPAPRRDNSSQRRDPERGGVALPRVMTLPEIAGYRLDHDGGFAFAERAPGGL
jgi:hypothetical protein